MLGRLLSHAFTPPNDNSLNEDSTFRTRSPTLGSLNDGFNRPENDDEIHPTFPVSFLDEADTRNLLYGHTFSTTGMLSLDISKDIRIAIICDSPCVEGFIYDSAREYITSKSPEKESPSLMVSTLSRVSALTRSFSSTALNVGFSTPPPPTSLLRPNTVASPLSGRSPKRNTISNTPSHRRTSSTSSTSNPNSTSSTVTHTTLPSQSSTPSTSSSQDIAPILPLTLLKEIVFGYSAMRFNGQLTKIHPLPKSKSNSRPWIVSRIFKINLDDKVNSAATPATPSTSTTSTTSTASTTSTSTSISTASTSAPPTDEFDLPTWKPKANITAPPLPPHIKDVRCAICITFNLQPESEDIITNHWSELSLALADLQSIIYSKLQHQLPQIILESRARKLSTTSTSYNYRYTSPKFNYTIDNDLEIQKSVEFFKSRFTTALRIPRVLCGQDNWPDLFRELCWASVKWENTSDGGFLAAMLATYIDFNNTLLKGTDADEDIPTRTIILANNRIIARKLIYILSSFIRTKTSEQIRKRINLSNYLNDTFVKAHNPKSSSVSTTTSVSSSPRSKASTKFSFVDGGWEISQSQSMIEPTGTVAIPHVVRPSFSSQSLAQSVGLTSTDGGLKSSRQGTFFSNFWNSDAAALPETLGTFYDDYYFNEPSYNDREMAYSLPNNSTIGENPNGTATPTKRPSLGRCHSSERTATTLKSINNRNINHQHDALSPNLYNRTLAHNASDSDLTNSSDDINYLIATPPNYRLINDDDQVFLDVSEPSTPVHYDESKPIILPRVAGHISSFHPDFILQGCPITRDVEDQISRTILRDSEVNPVSIALQRRIISGVSKKEILSKSLIINLRKRELSTYTLIATATGENEQHSIYNKMVRKTIFSNHKPAPEYAETFTDLSKKIHDVVEGETITSHSPNRTSHLETLMKSYESFFDLL